MSEARRLYTFNGPIDVVDQAIRAYQRWYFHEDGIALNKGQALVGLIKLGADKIPVMHVAIGEQGRGDDE